MNNPAVLNYLQKLTSNRIMGRLSDGQFDYKIFDKIGVRNSYQNQGLDNESHRTSSDNNLTFTHMHTQKIKMNLKSFVDKRIQELYKRRNAEKNYITVLWWFLPPSKLTSNKFCKSSILSWVDDFVTLVSFKL